MEEALPAPPVYLLQPTTVDYTVTDAAGTTTTQTHQRHDFTGIGQRYERLLGQMPVGTYTSGLAGVGAATVHVLDAASAFQTASTLLTTDPMALVETVEVGTEEHVLIPGTGAPKYRVGRA